METPSKTRQQSMQVHRIPFEQIRQFSKRDVAYVNSDKALRPFYKYSVDIDSFAQVIKDKSKQKIDRPLLVDVLQKQYAPLPFSARVDAQIKALSADTTYTVVTAHQPSLFTGPLYYIYKIISTIRLAKELNDHYSAYRFVPVFVTGGEDHDFEEMNHATIFNKRLQWENDESGAVGMMQTTSLQPVLEELQSILGESEHAQEIFELIQKTHTENTIYSDATIALAHALFEKEGLVILNMNQPDLKRAFIPILEQELVDQISVGLIENTQQTLEEAGFKAQAFPREINLFYLKEQLRERIVFEDNRYKVLNTNIAFSEKELLQELNTSPERFSPNVNMRPLYQEFILPNLAYIGGGGELAYWLERLQQFEYFHINFPMLIRRNSVLWIDKSQQKRMHKLDLTIQDLLQERHLLVKQYLEKNSSGQLDLEAQKTQLEQIFADIERISQTIDPTLGKAVAAEKTKQVKAIHQLENRLVRAEKQKHEIALKQIENLQEKLFPKNGLQERTDNFLPFFLKYGWEYFEVLKEYLNPLEKGMVVISA